MKWDLPLSQAYSVHTGIEKLWRVWQFERLFPVRIPFILILCWLIKHFPLLCCAFWKQISNKENAIFFAHSPTGYSHSTSLQLGPLSSYYISLRGSSAPDFRASACYHVCLLKILHFPYIPISFDPRDQTITLTRNSFPLLGGSIKWLPLGTNIDIFKIHTSIKIRSGLSLL